MSTGAGFLALFFTFHPFNPQKPLHVFWRWVTLPHLPPRSSSPSLSTCTHERCGGGWHPLHEGAGGEEEDFQRKEGEGDRDGLISTSSTFSSKPTRSSQAWQDPACPRPGSAACLRAGLSPPGGGGGAQYRQAAPQTKHFGRRKGKLRRVANARMLKHVFSTRLHACQRGKCKNSVNQPEFTIISINWPLTPTALCRQQTQQPAGSSLDLGLFLPSTNTSTLHHSCRLPVGL